MQTFFPDDCFSIASVCRGSLIEVLSGRFVPAELCPHAGAVLYMARHRGLKGMIERLVLGYLASAGPARTL